MGLSGQQRKQLQSALIDAFPTTASLEQMLAFGIEKNLSAIAGVGSLQDIVFKLIQAANAEGWVDDLVRAARDSNPGNPQLKAIAEEVLLNQSPERHTPQAPIVWSETRGSIGEYKEWVIPVKSTNVNLRNFIVEAQFDNPYDGEAYNWTYGFAFQENTSQQLNDPHRKSFDIWVTSKEKKWCFGTTNRFSDGYLSNLKVSEKSSNKLYLKVEGKIATFYLNDVCIENFDISNFTNKGDIFLIAKDGMSGKSIQYKNLKVWSLDIDEPETSSNILQKQTHQVQKILILAAIPQGLRLDKEIREVEEAIRRAANRDLFEIKVRTAVRPADIRRALAEEQPSIVHFCGHGLEDGSLLLEDDGGNNKPVAPSSLASLFKLHADYVKCVLLNACYSEKPAVAISQFINHVIGMNNPIEDNAAIEFVKGFYDGLGYKISGNQDVFQRAFDEGMVSIEMENLSQGGIPVLKKR